MLKNIFKARIAVNFELTPEKQEVVNKIMSREDIQALDKKLDENGEWLAEYLDSAKGDIDMFSGASSCIINYATTLIAMCLSILPKTVRKEVIKGLVVVLEKRADL